VAGKILRDRIKADLSFFELDQNFIRFSSHSLHLVGSTVPKQTGKTKAISRGSNLITSDKGGFTFFELDQIFI
jgi:hypothetical protein